jgi:hypothetical protein
MDYHAKSQGQNYFEADTATGMGAEQHELDQGPTAAAGGLPGTGDTTVASGAGPSIEGTNQDDLPTIEAARPNCIPVESSVPASAQNEYWT